MRFDGEQTDAETIDLVKMSETIARGFAGAGDDGGNVVKWTIPYEELRLDEGNLLGEGFYGKVYKGKLWGSTVAVKKMKMGNGSCM